MAQTFFDVPVDGEDFLCDTQECKVRVFCHTGCIRCNGICPSCGQMGKLVEDENYPKSKELQLP